MTSDRAISIYKQSITILEKTLSDVNTIRGRRKMKIYDKVKQFADEQGKPISQIEKDANLGNGVIGKWRNSEEISIKSIKAVADALNVSINELIGE